jgi:cell division protease FtsH
VRHPLDKRSNNGESAPARPILRLFGLDNSRYKESSAARNRSPKELEERKHQFAIWYIFAAFSA